MDVRDIDGGTVDGPVADGPVADTGPIADTTPADSGTDSGADAGSDANGDAAAAFAGPLPAAHAMAAGRTFSVAIDNSGALWTWGQASSGALGNGQQQKTGAHHGHALVPTRPVTIDQLSISHVSAGWTHVVALQSNGDVWTWGGNDNGQLGNNDTPNLSLVPTKIALGSAAVDVAAGAYFTLAVDSAGALWAWGTNGGNQLGNGTTTPEPAPAAVTTSGLPSGISFAAVAAGTDHALALAKDGTVWSWGSGGMQLGLGGPTKATTPKQVVDESGQGFLRRIVAIAAGSGHCVALADDGALWAWGTGSSGQLGNGGKLSSNKPVRVTISALTGTIVGIRAGENQSFALLSDGSLWGWGENDKGQLGSSGGDVSSPALIAVTGAKDVAGARDHGIAIDSTGDFWAWGLNTGGLLGTGLADDSTTPVKTYGPAGLSPTSISPAKEAYSFVKMSDGSLWGVGRGWQQSGGIFGGASPSLVTALAAINVEQIAGGQSHTLVLDTAKKVWAFGVNGNGQLGNSSNSDSSTPVAVDFSALPANTTITKVGVSGALSAALASDGTVWVWGLGRYGQLGNGTDGSSSTPVKVQDALGTGFLGGIVDLAVGGDHLVALDGSGYAWTWGIGSGGQLGATPLDTCTGSNNACNRRPQRVCDVGTDPASCTANSQYLGVVDEIAAGGSHTLLRQGDKVLGFGSKNVGQVGDGLWSSTTRVRVPIVVVNADNTGPLTGVSWIDATLGSSYAGTTSGAIYAWGDNARGQLALDPTTTTCGGSRYCRTRPTLVPGLGSVTITKFDAANNSAFALDSGGVIWTWGANEYGELGQLSTVTAPGGSRIGFTPAPITLLPR